MNNEECTTGWLKTKSGFIVFKTRDRKPSEEVNSNFINIQQSLLTIEDKLFDGCWLGANQHFCITHTVGPTSEVPVGYSGENENFLINKLVLEKASSIDEAVGLYIELMKQYAIGKSYNVIICDGQKAVCLEITPDKVCVEESTTQLLRTNTFQIRRELNTKPDLVVGSEARLTRLKKWLSCGDLNVENILLAMQSHGTPESENICRHDFGVTVGAVALEANNGKIRLYSLLNQNPCEGVFERHDIPWSMQTSSSVKHRTSC